MRFDPEKHHRRSVRLKEYDYCQPGVYFVTICTRHRECLLGEIVDGEMRLNPLGTMAAACWHVIPHHFSCVVLDEGIIMPNHIHVIIVIQGRGEASAVPHHVSNEEPTADASPLQRRPNGTQPGSLSAIVQNFKSISARRMKAARGMLGASIWQRGFYERIIRTEDELRAIGEYVLANPARWNEDENNPALLNSVR